MMMVVSFLIMEIRIADAKGKRAPIPYSCFSDFLIPNY